MKTCIHCGKELKEGAKFCPACGMAVPENAPEMKVAQAPEAREKRKQRPAQQLGAEPGHTQNAMAKETAPAPKKKRGPKWWHIAAAVLLVIAAAGGVLAYRVHKPYREARITYEDGAYCVQTFDDKGRILTETTYYEDGEVWDAYKFKSADGKGKTIVANVEQRKGVAHAECRERFQYVDYSGKWRHFDYVITGYDWLGNVVVVCESYNGYDIGMTKNYKLDFWGNPVARTHPVADYLKTEYENHYALGRLVSSDCTSSEYYSEHFTIEYIY